MRLYLSYELFLCGNNINHEYFTNFTMYHNHIKCIMKRPSPCIMNGHFDLTWGEGGALIWGMTWFDYYSRMQNTAADTRFVSFTLGHACKKDNAYNLSFFPCTPLQTKNLLQHSMFTYDNMLIQSYMYH